jgi:pathogenesis-related protein 1
MAAEWANNCLFENTNGMLSPQPYGENLAAGTGDFNAEAAVALFTQDKRMLRCAITILRV